MHSMATATEQPAGERPMASAAAAPRRWTHSSAAILLLRCALIAALLVAWEFLSGPVIPRFWISSPSAIGKLLFAWITTGYLWPHLWATLLALGMGFAAGAAAGILVGLALGFFPRADRVLSPFFAAIYSVPNVALAPLFIVLFGIGLESKVALVALTVFLLVLYSTIDGVRDVDVDQTNAMRLMGAKRTEIAAKLMVPSALPWIFNGMRLAVRYAFAAVIVAELMAANKGIGFLVEHYAGNFNATGVFAAIAVLVVCSILMLEVLGRAEDRRAR
jgi:NitT/TauT family transport system permease protein